MRLLVVDNGSSYFPNLLGSLKKHKLNVVRFGGVKLEKADNFDKVILSGGSLPVVRYRKEYSNELNLIKNSKVPVLGICLGCELIAETFGERLTRMEAKENGITDVSRTSEDLILDGLDKFKVFESHRWIVKKCEKLVPLAKSKKGIEIFRHPKKEIYGVQFHPEMYQSKTDGKIVLDNFLRR